MTNVKKEELVLNDKVKFDDKGGSILGVLEGPVADFINPTRNGRHYSEELWEKVFKNPLVQEQFKNGGIVGELDHPADRDDICTEKVAIIMPEPPVKKNGQYYGKFNILNTPCGKIVYTLAKAGFKLGVSSRGTGDVVESYEGEEVEPDTYEFTCFDVVLLPAVESARMNLVTESLDTKKVDYKKLLKESLDTSTDSEKKVIEETLDHLNIKLNEEKEENKKVCCICGKEFEGWGNNAQPVKDGVCCDECNRSEVIPARLKSLGLRESLKLKIKGPEDTEFRLPNKEGDNEHIVIDTDIWNKVENDEISDKPIEWEKDGWTCELIKEDLEEESSVEEVELEEPEEEKEPEVCDLDCKIAKLYDKFSESLEELPEETSYEDVKEKFIELFKEEFPEECFSESCADKEEVQPETEEAGDSGVEEIIEQLQDILKENKRLKEDLENLQKSKAVSDAKVSKLTEDVNTFKSIAANAGKAAVKLNGLDKKYTSLQENYATLEAKFNQQSKELELQKSSNAKVQELTENLDKVTQESKARIEELTSKLDSSKKLTEKYKKLAHSVADRYIESKAVSLGITTNEIKNRLNESYTLDDVDKICESLQDYSLNISKLPFALNKPGSVKMRVREDKSKDPLRSISSQYDDTVDDYLLDLAGLNK
jgi:hypothetical protein